MNKKTRFLTMTALFLALILLLGSTPLGLIPLGFVNVTILAVPVVIGTILLGLGSGLVLGFFFGAVSALSMFGMTMTAPSALASALAAANPVLALIMCFVPRLLIPVVTDRVYRLIAGKGGRKKRALPIAAAAGSLTNTVFYLGLMLAFYNMVGLDDSALRAVIAGVSLLAGGSEAVVNALITTPVVVALWKAGRKYE
jgi:uncharacterized membrane protein